METNEMSAFIHAIQQATLIGTKQYLTFQESLLYLGMKKSFFFQRINDFRIQTTPSGYYKKSDLDRIMTELPPKKRTDKSADGPATW